MICFCIYNDLTGVNNFIILIIKSMGYCKCVCEYVLPEVKNICASIDKIMIVIIKQCIAKYLPIGRSEYPYAPQSPV